MPINIPTENDIKNNMVDDFVARLSDPAVRLENHPLNVLATVLAASVADLYGQLSNSVTDSFVTTASATDLDRLGNIWDLQRGQGTKATGTLIFTGAVGTNITSGIKLASSDGTEFITNNASDVEIPANGMADISVEAIMIGNAGNLPADSVIGLSKANAGLNPSATVNSSALTGGTNKETDSAYRVRLLLQVRNPSKGGAVTDYERWVLDRSAHFVAVSKVFITPPSVQANAGVVDIQFLIESGVDLMAMPSADNLTAITDYLNIVRPVGAILNVSSASTETVVITVVSTQLEDGITLQEATNNITIELNALFLRVADITGSLKLSQIYETIAGATGIASFTLSNPTDSITAATGNVLKLGALSVS